MRGSAESVVVAWDGRIAIRPYMRACASAKAALQAVDWGGGNLYIPDYWT